MSNHPNRSPRQIPDRQRAADAAFFEDWSAWASLDDLPAPDRRHGHYLQWPAAHNRCWCKLRLRVNWMGGACFELCLPPSTSICDIVMALPGARQHPTLNGIHRQANRGLRDTWFVPAEHWPALRKALPEIKRGVLEWRDKRAAETTIDRR